MHFCWPVSALSSVTYGFSRLWTNMSFAKSAVSLVFFSQPSNLVRLQEQHYCAGAPRIVHCVSMSIVVEATTTTYTASVAPTGCLPFMNSSSLSSGSRDSFEMIHTSENCRSFGMLQSLTGPQLPRIFQLKKDSQPLGLRRA